MLACMRCHTRGLKSHRRWRHWECKIIPSLCSCRCVITTLQYFMTADLSACLLLFQRHTKPLRVQRSGWSRHWGDARVRFSVALVLGEAWSCSVLTFLQFQGCLPCPWMGCNGSRQRGYRCESRGVVLTLMPSACLGYYCLAKAVWGWRHLPRWWRQPRQRRFCRFSPFRFASFIQLSSRMTCRLVDLSGLKPSWTSSNTPFASSVVNSL